MRSRAARLVLGAAAWLTIAAAAAVVVTFERRTVGAREQFRGFDEQAHRAADTISDLRVGQQAYVATGQGVGFWMPKVGATMDAAAELLTALRRAAASQQALAAIDEASEAIADLRAVDTRARDYLENMQPLMAGDVVFTEGEQNAVAAGRAVEQARVAEREALDAAEAANRRLEAIAVAAAAVVGALSILLLVPVAARPAPEPVREAEPVGARKLVAPPPPVVRPAPGPSPLMKVASLCTDFGRVRDLAELERLLGRTADLMEASGVMLWMGDVAGANLRPMLAVGYPAGVLERLPSVPRSADNAAAAAYRTGSLQIVLAKAGRTNGAIVAPVLAASGCIGAFSAELRGGAEVSDQNQAVAALVAAHLASVLAPASDSAPEVEARAEDAGAHRAQAAAG